MSEGKSTPWPSTAVWLRREGTGRIPLDNSRRSTRDHGEFHRVESAGCPPFPILTEKRVILKRQKERMNFEMSSLILVERTEYLLPVSHIF